MRALARPLALLAALSLGACRGGCGKRPGAPAGQATLASLPADTRFVLSVDLARIRATPLWARLSALAADDPVDRERLRELTRRTGLDPLRQIHRVVAAFPENARQRGQFALVIEGEGFDEHRLVGYARAEAATRGGRITERTRGARTLWSSPGGSSTAAFFVGQTRLVVAGGGWAEELADLAGRAAGQGPSAAGNPELVHLVTRLEAGRSLWFAALVPPELRKSFLADPKLTSAASVMRLAGGADLGPGLTAELVADLSNAADARALVARVQTTVRESKLNAQVLMMGLGPYLDALAATADGPRLRVTLTLSPDQVQELIERLNGLVRLARTRRPR